MRIIFFLFLAVFCYILWQKWELTKFGITEYRIFSSKIKKRACAAVISDLHGFSYGKENWKLSEKIKKLESNFDIVNDQFRNIQNYLETVIDNYQQVERDLINSFSKFK